MIDPLVSIIIANYNYERYVAQALESALAVDWHKKEIIVVDDGSTDRSREVIAQYVDRGVTACFIENRGQAAAAEAGFYKSSGDLVIFLDADDLLDPQIIREALGLLRPGVSKAQFQMKAIDAEGRQTGEVFPIFRRDISPRLIRKWISETDSASSPPGSGNMYTREFLSRLFPIDKSMDRFLDSYCVSCAPLLGDVVSIPKPLVSYRVHGLNDGAMLKFDLPKLSKALKAHLARCDYATRKARECGVRVEPQRWRFGLNNLLMRIASLRLSPENHPIPEDTMLRCLADALRSVVRDQGYTAARHWALFFWVIAISATPRPLMEKLASWRFAPATRPSLIRIALNRA